MSTYLTPTSDEILEACIEESRLAMTNAFARKDLDAAYHYQEIMFDQIECRSRAQKERMHERILRLVK